MEIILLEKVTSLGVLGDRVKVKPGINSSSVLAFVIK